MQGPTEKEQIDVQGDITYDVVDFITETWPSVSLLLTFRFTIARMHGIELLHWNKGQEDYSNCNYGTCALALGCSY
jgi:hypothetical protein